MTRQRRPHPPHTATVPAEVDSTLDSVLDSFFREDLLDEALLDAATAEEFKASPATGKDTTKPSTTTMDKKLAEKMTKQFR
ncbi:hypothetical protein ADEAN_000912100 [Angomonas deanei]|uniref:Uncharacterized protein n=1 Tax=Angomonas deanei TaxID=59799 RepID=A0A7G2CQG0_9TRYP|nr:hypothetical protein ADEAN_000912100 [Angomonas deanei]